MDYDNLKDLNEKFAKEAAEFVADFGNLFRKWILKSPRLASVMIIHIPINCIMGAIEDEVAIHDLFPDLPDVFIRFMMPFVKLQDRWGKVSGKEFADEYKKLYESQFSAWFINQEERKNFEKWFEKQNGRCEIKFGI
jgi:hypothetical protein